jgi:hypothetical protein
MRSKAPEEVREIAPSPLCCPPRSYLFTAKGEGERPRWTGPSGPKRNPRPRARRSVPRLTLILLALAFLVLLLASLD